MTEATDVIVIGAGHNGLTCASVLAKSGLRVTVLESRDEVGGMSSTCTLQGSYRFPGLANTAFPISPIVSRALDLDRHGYTPGSPASTISLQEDGRHLSIGPDGSELAGVDDADQTAYTNLIEDFRSWAEALEPLMLNKPPRLKNMDAADKRTFAKLGWKVRIGLGKASMYEFLRIAAINIYDVLNENLDDERLKGAIAADAVFGHNMGPRTPGTVFTCLLHQFNARSGARSVVAGDGSQLVEALRRSAESHGAEVKFGSTVAKILVGDGRACGVELSDGTTLLAKRIASSADARTTFLKHIGAAELDAMFT